MLIQSWVTVRPNADIRQLAKEKKVRLYEIADALKIYESELSKILRRELPQASKMKLRQVIDNIAKARS